LLEGLYLVRSLPPWTHNAGKRLVKSPKVYRRDSGILHTLAGLPTMEKLLGHPLCGASWEGYCLEQIIAQLPNGATASHYRTQAGAEVDLVIEQPDGQVLAVEIKRTLSPKVTPGLTESMNTLGAGKGVIIIPEGESYPLSRTVTAASLRHFLESTF
jgi:predicted AAA+ superfamily ATPase